MKKTLFILLFSSMFMLGATREYNGETKKELDTTVVVSLKEDTRYSKKNIQDYFYNNLTYSIGFNYRKVDSFTKLTNVVTIKINSSDLEKIKELPYVSSAYKEIEYTAYDYSIDDPDFNEYSMTKVPSNYSSIDMNKGSSGDGENTLVAVLDTSLNYYHEAFKTIDTSSIRYSKSEVSTIVSNNTDFHAKNYKWLSDKVPFSYDYVGDYTYSKTEDDDVISYQEHGTHVASIAAGNGKYKGIASEAQIAFFKVFTNSGSGCTTSIYLKALEDAYSLDVDAINMSFGSTLLYEDETEDIAVNELINKMSEEGIECFVASGNDGKNAFNASNYKYSSLSNTETGSSGSLATNNLSNSIGSYTTKSALNNILASDGTYSYKINDRIVSRTSLSQVDNSSYYEVDTTKLSKEYRFNDFIGKGSIETIVIPNYGAKEDYDGLDCKNKIAIVNRGSITFYEKIDAAMNAGAKGLIICSQKSDSSQTPYFGYELQDTDKDRGFPTLTKNGKTYYDYTKINIPVAVMSYTESINIKKASSLTFFQDDISSFSSQGGDPSLSLKPDFIAPGSNIYGAATIEYTKFNDYYNTSKKTYATDTYIFKNGTSMATPNAMGAYASILSNYDLSSEESRKEARLNTINKIRSNATILKDSDGIYYSPRIQGAGLINISNTNNSNSYLTYNNKSKVELKNNDDIKSGHIDFDVTFNSSNENDELYNIKVTVMAPKTKDVEGLGSVVTTSDTIIDSYSFTQTLSDGDTITIDRTLSNAVKEYLKEFNNGTYLEGYVEVTSNDESLSIPFLGYYGTNYDLIKPYEDFDFEKENNNLSSDYVYESDLIKDYIVKASGLNEDKVNIESKMLIGQDDYNPHSNTYFAYYLRNCNDYAFGFTSKNSSNYSDIDAYYNKEEDTYDIYTDSISNKRGLTIQLFMLKAIKEGKILVDNELQEDSSINYFIDTTYRSVTKQLFKNYVVLQSTAFSESYTHKTIGYISFVKDGTIGNQILDNGKHTITFEFTTFNNNILRYTYNLYINEKYGITPTIYDVTYKNNLLTITLENVNELKKVTANNEEIEVDYTLSNDSKCIIKIDTSKYEEDSYFTFFNQDLKSVSLKYFASSDLKYAYGSRINSDTYFEESINEDRYTSGDYNYKYTKYVIRKASSNVSDTDIHVGFINLSSDDLLYKTSIGDSTKVDMSLMNEGSIDFVLHYDVIIKLSDMKENEKPTPDPDPTPEPDPSPTPDPTPTPTPDDDKNKDNSNSNTALIVTISVCSVVGAIVLIVAIIFLIKRFK